MQTVEDFKKNSYSEKAAIFDDLLVYAAKLETKVALLEYRKYGRSSEKFVDPEQGTISNEPEAILDQSPDTAEQEEEDLKPAILKVTKIRGFFGGTQMANKYSIS